MTVEGFDETLLTQNPELGMKPAEVAARFMFRTIMGEINMVVEVGLETIKKLHRSQLKMGWLICRAGDYLVAKRCYKCSRYNHKHHECKGEETLSSCAGGHLLKDCKTPPNQHKCINCMNYNRHS
jgi:hypothetical protein